MTEPVTVPPDRVVQELCSEPLGRALWERAQYVVLSQVQAERIEQMEKASADASNKTAPTTPPGSGWEVPGDGEA